MARPRRPQNRVTTHLVAQHAGVSQGLVSRILNGDASGVRARPETIERVRTAARELNYRPNAAAKALSQDRMQVIGAVMLNSGRKDREGLGFNLNTFQILLGANIVLQKHDYLLTLTNVSHDEHNENSLPESRVFREHTLDGALVVGSVTDAAAQRTRDVLDNVIFVDTNQWDATHCIRRDEALAGRIAARELIERGASRVVWLGMRPLHPGDLAHFSHDLRREGVESACADAGIDCLCFAFASGSPAKWDLESLAPMLEPSTAVVTYNDKATQWLVYESTQRGKLPGRDYRLACCDLTRALHAAMPRLAGVDFDRPRIGMEAADLLLALISGQQSESKVVADRWIDGDSASVS